jgi:hypothetical protein
MALIERASFHKRAIAVNVTLAVSAAAQHAWRSVLADAPNGFAIAVGNGYRDGLTGKGGQS